MLRHGFDSTLAHFSFPFTYHLLISCTSKQTSKIAGVVDTLSDQPFKLASKPTFNNDDLEISKDSAVEEHPLYFRPVLRVLRNV